jgi:hypothetical protein
MKVTPSPAGIDQLLAESAALVVAGAAAVAENASQIVHKRTGKTAESYSSTPAVVTPTGVRATAYTDSPVGHLVEWGTAKMAPQAPLRRGAERAGLRTRLAAKGS